MSIIRSPIVPACLVAALFAAGCGGAAAPRMSAALPVLWDLTRDGPGPAEEAAVPGAPGRLSAMTFNMQHRDRVDELDVLADYLREDVGVPDFILCQEVVFDRGFLDVPESTAAVLGNALGYHTRGTQRKGNCEGIAIVSRYPLEGVSVQPLEYNQLRFRSRCRIADRKSVV